MILILINYDVVLITMWCLLFCVGHKQFRDDLKPMLDTKWGCPLLFEVVLYYLRLSFTIWGCLLLFEVVLYYLRLCFTIWGCPLLFVIYHHTANRRSNSSKKTINNCYLSSYVSVFCCNSCCCFVVVFVCGRWVLSRDDKEPQCSLSP